MSGPNTNFQIIKYLKHVKDLYNVPVDSEIGQENIFSVESSAEFEEKLLNILWLNGGGFDLESDLTIKLPNLCLEGEER